jgi:hypothetical protein
MANAMNGNPIAVTLVGDPLAQQLKTAAQTGSFQVNTRPGHHIRVNLAPTTARIQHLMRPLGATADVQTALSSDPWTVVIINSLPNPLVLAGTEPRTGAQIGYPAIADFGKHATKEHQIPGTFDDPAQPGNKLYGVGAYQMDWGSVEYVWSFSYKADGKSGPLVAVAMKKLGGWIDPLYAVTADVNKFNGPKAFYDNLSNSGQNVQSEAGAETTILASYSDSTIYVWVHDSKSTT